MTMDSKPTLDLAALKAIAEALERPPYSQPWRDALSSNVRAILDAAPALIELAEKAEAAIARVAELEPAVGGTAKQVISLRTERDALKAELAETKLETNEFAAMSNRLRGERDLLRVEAEDNAKLANEYKATFADLGRNLDAAVASWEGQRRNTAALAAELAALKAAIADPGQPNAAT